MENKLVFKRPCNARTAAFFDRECFQKGGYILKKFADGYRYFPLGSNQTYVRRNWQVVELGQHVSIFYWSSQIPARSYKKRIDCLVIPFKREPSKV